jgi:methionyl-tRNA synthetase
MPQAAARLLDLIAAPADRRDFKALGGASRLAPGGTLPPPAPVFPRYVEQEQAS